MDVFQMSLSSVVLIIAVVIIRGLALHKLPKKTFLILWGIVVCRLLVPFSVPSRFSFFTGVDVLKRMFSEPAPFPALTGAAGMYEMGEMSDFSFTEQQPSGVSGSFGVSGVPTASFSPVLIIWLAGMGVSALFFIVTYIRWRREFQTSLPAQNDSIDTWLQEHPMRRQVQIRQCDKIEAPLTYGVLRPVVLLPKTTDWTDETRLRYILAHEFVISKGLTP